MISVRPNYTRLDATYIAYGLGSFHEQHVSMFMNFETQIRLSNCGLRAVKAFGMKPKQSPIFLVWLRLTDTPQNRKEA